MDFFGICKKKLPIKMAHLVLCKRMFSTTSTSAKLLQGIISEEIPPFARKEFVF